MIDRGLRDRLLQGSRDACARHEAAEAGLRQEALKPAAAGDLYLADDAEGFDGEWALLAEQSHGRFLAVPADTVPLVGPGDLEVVEAISRRVLVLRCAADVSLPRAALGRRTGRLGRDRVTAALKCLDRARAGGPASYLAEDTALDPEYREWIESAIKPLRRAHGGPSMHELESGVGDEPAPGRLRMVPMLGAVLVTAGVVALAAGLWHQRSMSELEQRLTAGQGTEAIPVVRLIPGDPSTQRLSVPAAASHLLLKLEASGPEEVYDCALSLRTAGDVVWRTQARSHGRELALIVPTHLLSTDRYVLTVRPAGSEETVITQALVFEQ